MTDISPENVARMLDGVTPGPWHAAGPPWNQIIYSSGENRVAFTAHSNGLDDDRDIATARFIAWAREAVPALAAERDALAARLAEVEENLVGVCQREAASTVRWEAKLDAAEAREAKLRAAAEALGALPEGYCFCSKDRTGDDRKKHEPECAELRTILMEKKS